MKMSKLCLLFSLPDSPVSLETCSHALTSWILLWWSLWLLLKSNSWNRIDIINFSTVSIFININYSSVANPHAFFRKYWKISTHADLRFSAISQKKIFAESANPQRFSAIRSMWERRVKRGSHGVNKDKAVRKVNKPFSSYNFIDFMVVGKKLNFI